jgi:hypothetical protein
LESPKLKIEEIRGKYPNLTEKDIPDLTGARVKITDFGIARQVRESMSRYSRGDTSGTLIYMSPEQVRGKGVDHRSDLYSLGVTLYELLTGDPPFTGDSLAHQILSEEPEPIEKISSRMNDILLKLLSKDKEHRYADADTLIRALEGKTDDYEERKKEQAFWEECRRNNTLEAYRRYLARYPQGRYVSAAKAEISKIEKAEDQKREREAKRKEAEEDAFWEACRSEDTLEAYRRYIEKYPLGSYVVDAQVTIRRKELESAPVEEEKIAEGETEPNISGFAKKFVVAILAILFFGFFVTLMISQCQVRKADQSAQSRDATLPRGYDSKARQAAEEQARREAVEANAKREAEDKKRQEEADRARQIAAEEQAKREAEDISNRRTCEKCQGTGECYKCNGTGKEIIQRQKMVWDPCPVNITNTTGSHFGCKYCGGTGKINNRSINYDHVSNSPCDLCNGKGKCSRCDGRGWIRRY